MTRGEVITKVLSEVSGKPEREIAAFWKLGLASIPPEQHNFDEELSDADADALLAVLRKGKQGIADWIMKGHRDSVLMNAKPAGRA